MAIPQQPIDRALPVDADLRGAWLGKSVAHANLGADASPAGDDLTPVNAPRAERVGCHFTAASSQYLRRAEADWRIADEVGTISAWIKRDIQTARHCIFSSADEAGAITYFYLEVPAFASNASHLRFNQRDGGATTHIVDGSAPLLADQWYYVVLVSDGSAWSMYVNGQPETLTIVSGANNGNWLVDTPNRDNVIIGALQTIAVAIPFDGTIKDVQYRSRVVPAVELLYEYRQGVPDDDLAFWTMGGMTDLSRFARTPTHTGGVVVGHHIHLDGVDDLVDWGDLGDIQAVSMWVRPETTTEEILRVDAGNDVMVNAGVVTYTGLTPVATYVGGAAGTALGADEWQHLVCVFESVDANNFELGTDGANFGETDQRDVRAYDRIPSADEVAQMHAMTRRAY